jgi:predicted dehydrogenase
MALDLTPEQKEIGKENAAKAQEELSKLPSRRDLLRGTALATAAVAGTSAAIYFGYNSSAQGKAVKTALIGGGDEDGVLVGEHNPEYLQFIAVCDVRPSNMKRIFEGDPKTPLRKGFKKVYGAEAERIRKYDDYLTMLREEKELEAVVIALPLHLHARVAVDCMKAGEERVKAGGKPIHVLCEKLMAWNGTQCKQMISWAKKSGSILSIGHQRHYSLLYAHAADVMASGVLGDVRHIRALWHRNFTWDAPKDENASDKVKQPKYRDGWYGPVPKEDYEALVNRIAKLKCGSHQQYDDIEQLVRWRLHAQTGGGLMAELGSHQLDATSIFLGKVHPLAVTGVGVKSFYGPGRNDRDIFDHVFVTYEFPGKNYHPTSNKDDRVIVTYSSISTNGFEPYGECVMGTRGTMIVEAEQNLMLYMERDPGKKLPAGAPTSPRNMAVTVSETGKGKPALEASSTWGGPAAGPAGGSSAGGATATAGPVSRGYREEMEDFAFCIRQWDHKLGYAHKKDGDKETKEYEQRLPRCHGEVAMADALIALTANRAMQEQKRLEFKDEWFHLSAKEIESGDYVVPEGEGTPKVPVE